jgi:hypothetical protein
VQGSGRAAAETGRRGRRGQTQPLDGAPGW